MKSTILKADYYSCEHSISDEQFRGIMNAEFGEGEATLLQIYMMYDTFGQKVAVAEINIGDNDYSYGSVIDSRVDEWTDDGRHLKREMMPEILSYIITDNAVYIRKDFYSEGK